MVAPRYGSWRIAFRRELVTSSTSGKEMLPGEIVTTFKPALVPPLLGGGFEEGATCVTWCDSGGGGDDGETIWVSAIGALLGPMPDCGAGVFDDRGPLPPTGRTGRGGTLGI